MDKNELLQLHRKMEFWGKQNPIIKNTKFGVKKTLFFVLKDANALMST